MDEATRLFESGYRCVSNRYRIVARLDRPDWKEHMAREHVKGFPGDPEENFEQGMRWANGLGDSAADYYRRVHSKDQIEIMQLHYDKIKRWSPGSGWGGCNEYHELIPCP